MPRGRNPRGNGSLADPLEVIPTRRLTLECGCIWIGFHSYIGNEVYWHVIKLCGKCKRQKPKTQYLEVNKK